MKFMDITVERESLIKKAETSGGYVFATGD